jgi:hypothetical protein
MMRNATILNYFLILGMNDEHHQQGGMCRTPCVGFAIYILNFILRKNNNNNNNYENSNISPCKNIIFTKKKNPL